MSSDLGDLLQSFTANIQRLEARVAELETREDANMPLVQNNAIVSPLDPFGNVQVAGPNNRFDCEFLYDKQPLIIDEVAVTGGTATHNTNGRDVTLAINNTTTATEISLYSHIDVPYTPGNGQIIDVTGVLNLANIAGGTAQLFLRSNVTGIVTEEVYNQEYWHSPQLDADWSLSHIFAFGFQSLKVGSIFFYMAREGNSPTKVHQINNDNIRNSGYWQRATLPPMWRMYNDATHTYAEMGYGDEENAIGFRYRLPKIATATAKAICATVKSYGGVSIQDLPGYTWIADNDLTPVIVGITKRPVLSIRVASTFNSLVNRSIVLPRNISIRTDNPIKYEIYYRPTLTGAVFNPTDAHSGVEFDVSATAFSGGFKVGGDYVATVRNTQAGKEGILDRTLMSLGRTGISDILTIVAVRDINTNADVKAVISGKTIR